MKEIARIIQLEWKLDWRNRAALASILAYILSAVFLCLQSFRKVDDPLIWNNLFWLVIIFGCANALIRSNATSGRGRNIYMYFMAKPSNIIAGKMLYQVLVILALAFTTLLFFCILLGTDPLKDINLGLYITTIIAGSAGISIIFTLISAMASKAGNKMELAPILGFVLVIPLLLSLNELCVIAVMHLPSELANEPMLITVSTDLLVATLAYILFPYIWTE